MKIITILQQTISVDYFKIITSFVGVVLGSLVALNSFWLKKYLTDNKEYNDKNDKKIEDIIKSSDKKFNELIKTWDVYNDKLREENFKMQLSQENIKKDYSGIEKRLDEATKMQRDSIDKQGDKLEKAQNEIIILREFMQNINEKYEKLLKETNKISTTNEMINFLQIQLKNLQDQIKVKVN